MPDPFDVLHTPLPAVDPDPGFAARLRGRVTRALSFPKGVLVSETTLATEEPITSSPLTPYLIVTDARSAIGWYVDVFGAHQRAELVVMPDGRVGHAEVMLRGSVLYLAEETPDSAVAAPRPDEPATVSLVVEMPDVDVAVDRAARAGAAVERAPADNPYGRNAGVRDPFGHRWIVSAIRGSRAPASETMHEGDIAYASLWVPDLPRAQAFFASVLGWSFAPGSDDRSAQVVGTSTHHGVRGGYEHPTLFLCYAVDDVDAAIDRVRSTGGEAEIATDEAYGRVANCTDDQGTPFAVFCSPPGEPALRPGPHGVHQGDVAYVTLEVVDATAARAFYGAVLGWSFTPGRVPDGWQVEGVHPMVGLHGGQATALGVPMYLVDDVAAAVARVRSAGGTATDPQRQPYGLTADCTDDQGTRFYLGAV